VDQLVETNTSEKHAVSIFRAEVIISALKRWLLPSNLLSNLTQKNIIRMYHIANIETLKSICFAYFYSVMKYGLGAWS
jgi:ABC-type antimicrobial peptide transport system permease subunit